MLLYKKLLLMTFGTTLVKYTAVQLFYLQQYINNVIVRILRERN
jgi:hypothetical protein